MANVTDFAPLPTALGQRKKYDIIWKGFTFPQSVSEFKIAEDTKVATYSYAGRNGAEHERVLNYRVISLTGVFTNMSGAQTPEYYVQKLRSLNDNIPGVLQHSRFGRFTCIMKNLSIVESASAQEVVGQEVQSTYSWTAEFWEHTDPSQVTLGSDLEKLFPAATVRPPDDNYATRLLWNTPKRLFQAIQTGKIEPGTDPIKNSDWLSYPLEQRTIAYNYWVAYLDTGIDPFAVITVAASSASKYRVPPGGNALKASVDTGIPLPDLFIQNRGVQVRNSSNIDDPQMSVEQNMTWNTPMDLRPGDIINASPIDSSPVSQ